MAKEGAVINDIKQDGDIQGPVNVVISSELRVPGTSGGRLLEIERARASFGVDALAQYIYGDAHLERMQRILSVVEKDPAFDKSRIHYMGRMEKYEFGVRKEKRLAQLILENNWGDEDTMMAEFLIDVPGTFNLHRSMWTKTVRDQCTEEQQQMFLEASKKYEIIGCYSQTELGHGSNVQGLETTATYIPEDGEFEMNSPTLTSAKWWSGGLGKTATHSCVMAQLVIKGRNYGPHPFIVPIRDPQTRKPLKGCTIGDIGPKVGFNTVDNGFLLLDHVRIPHNHFFAKYSQIDKATGKYTKPAHEKLSYGTMTYIRAGIVRSARDVIARAVTIAIRYCAVRRQFADKDAPQLDDRKPAETQVLNYSMVQYRLLPILAQAYAFHFTGVAMFKLYTDNLQNMRGGDFSLLADTHALSSALKSISTITAAGAIEECRRACGGHGYSSSAGMGQQYADYLPQVTWEGDSYMLTQQAARYLMKTFRTVYDNRDTETKGSITIQYIKDYLADPFRKAGIKYSGDLHGVDMFVDAFGFRAAYIVGQLVKRRDIERRTWNSLLVEMYRASKAHAQFYLIYNFAQALKHDENLTSQPALLHIMQTVFELFACHTMDTEAADFMMSNYLSAEQAEMLRSKTDELLPIIRTQAVPLVEAFKLPDYLLNSSLGRSDGEVYKALFDFAVREPINGHIWNPDIWSDELRMGTTEKPKVDQAKL